MAKRDEAAKLRRQIKALQKRGYMFPKGYTPTPGANLYEVAFYIDQSTPTPHAITGMERRAQERSIAARKAAETRRRRALITDPETTQCLPTDLGKVLTEIQRKIDEWQPLTEWVNPNTKGESYENSAFTKVKTRDKNKLKAMLDMAIAQEGAHNVAARLEEHAEMANMLATQILYGGSGDKADFNYMQGELAGFAQILLGRNLSTHESIDLEQQIESFMPA
nr:MAG TPA: hypothetical protein [Caudoviricetes sp.]